MSPLFLQLVVAFLYYEILWHLNLFRFLHWFSNASYLDYWVVEKPRLLRDSNRRESGLWLSVVSIDALQPISKDTDNNNVMYICWWTNKKS